VTDTGAATAEGDETVGPDVEPAGAYAAVHARPDGDGPHSSTVSRMALTAADCGFDGIVVRNHDDATADDDPSTLRGTDGIDVVDGVEIRADDPSRAAGAVASERERRTVVCVHGGEETLDRFAVGQQRVDVLAHPGELDHVLVRRAARNGVRVEANLGPLLRGGGGRRVRAIARLRRLRRLVEKYDAPHVASGDPTTHLGVRGPRELAAVGETVGIGAEFVREGLREWARIAARNRERSSERFIDTGVRRGNRET